MILTSTLRQLASWAVLFFIITVSQSRASTPHLYREPAYESPVSGEPDELLLIAGYGLDADDRVVYRAVDSDDRAEHPVTVPQASTPIVGAAEIVSVADLPYSLTIRLPKMLRPRQEYAFWVVTPHGEWSLPVRINDARPLWATPAFVYASAALASLPRYLKVVGLNLEPVPHQSTRVRLTGPQPVVLDAEPADATATDLDRYAAYVRLPAQLKPGAYGIELTRDGSHWVSLAGQTLEVRADPPRMPEFEVGAAAYGGCRPEGGQDATACVVRAITAAQAAGGGTVMFAAGTWTLSRAAMASRSGIEVPPGVSLQGAGTLATTISLVNDGNALAAFTLMGHNRVQGITFHDQRVYATGRELDTILKLGAGPVGALPEADAGTDVEDIVITRNVFDRPNIAISDSGSRIKHLFITDNEFGAYKSALELAGNRFLVSRPFNLEDSVITGNVFKPGSYLDVKARQGSLASEIGASRRVDFSENRADGTATDRLYAPNDARGWRAAFFWHMNNNQEMLLVSRNVASCTGDKAGDGEAIAYDNNANTFGLERAESVLRAGPSDVAVEGPLVARQNSRDVPAASYYLGHWVQIAEGPGIGQVRKIVSYTQDQGGAVTLKVSPAWDVIPATGRSRASIGREFWQVYTVANTVDQRAPPCQKSNRTAHKGGAISVWAQTADSAVAGNRQYDTDGILYQQYYNAEEAGCESCQSATFYIDFLQIRDNLIEGEYDWADDCSSSGIFGSMAAGETPHSPPPTASYGVTIAYNSIDHADGWQGGAISLLPTWFEGPAPHRWPLVASTLIDHNSLLGLHGPAASLCRGGPSHPRTAISLGNSALTRATVLYANACPDADRPLEVKNAAVVKVCPADGGRSCECESP
jgi:hypothetical protein